MHATDVQSYARKLMDAHGTRAIAEAAQKAKAYEDQGNTAEAANWRKIEAALKIMAGPRET